MFILILQVILFSLSFIYLLQPRAMAKSIVSLPILYLLLLLSFNSGELPKLAYGQDKTWCVAKPSTNDTALDSNITYACGQLGIQGRNCKLIQEGGTCYYPNTLINHASVVMNLYYQTFGSNRWNCDFSGSALFTITDPSYGSCQYA